MDKKHESSNESLNRNLLNITSDNSLTPSSFYSSDSISSEENDQIGLMQIHQSPLPNRSDIDGNDDDLTDMEVFYLKEIESFN